MVKIYTAPFCSYCRMAKEYFKKNNIAYEEIDVTKDDKLLNEMIKKSHQMSVPVIDINSEIFVGFNRTDIDQVIKKVA